MSPDRFILRGVKLHHTYMILTWWLHYFSAWLQLQTEHCWNCGAAAGLASLPGVWIGCCQWCEKCSLRLKVSPRRCHAGRAIARAGRGFSPFQKLPIFDFQSFISWLRFSQDFFLDVHDVPNIWPSHAPRIAMNQWWCNFSPGGGAPNPWWRLAAGWRFAKHFLPRRRRSTEIVMMKPGWTFQYGWTYWNINLVMNLHFSVLTMMIFRSLC